MALGAEIEAKAFAKGCGELVRGQGLVALENLCDCFHWIIIDVIFLDLGRVKTGISFNLDHEATISGRGQVLAAEITREVDHQRFIPQELLSRSQASGQVHKLDSNLGGWVRPSPVLVIPGIQKRTTPVKASI